MTTEQYLHHVQAIFLEKGDLETAQGQMRYMRNQFEYYGLKAGHWMALSKVIFKEKGILEGEELKEFARLCFEDVHRELHYFALEMVQKTLKKQPTDFIHLLEELISTKSWWDTVDWLSKLVGIHFKKFPELIQPMTERWMASGNFWLQRVCLIFQLTYREKTDFDLMKKCILQIASSKEFFLQKGAGWALRQHSRTDQAGVADFVENNPQLSALTKREAMRLILANKSQK
ncbi:MAG: DNA alkylation repair protein [Saprospiraceae bacterium]|nr:DNA alkylation repair protein [Saprospiraceae bacterium]MCF8251375.1 DNA alkylation repair protein [Saprospiraceae bacterium]MCF8280550.1 DNA alkylation repair protein [Bacteroidales bacterium]MCF8313232.1 DNA alkylation repair protein [Saprospiraceae bacterium]MCF8441679.1 DNA alkylation repair protein [Saprospiraceae bacterium]